MVDRKYKLYKRIMKHDPKAIDEIESLDEAKEIIKMMAGNVYLHGVIYENVKRNYLKHDLLIALKDVAFCVVEEYKDGYHVAKNRYGDRTMESIKSLEFEKVKLSELDGTDVEIRKKYYRKNVWLLMS